MKLHSDEKFDRAIVSQEDYRNYQIFENYISSINKFFRNFWTDCNSKDDNIFGVETFDSEMPPFLRSSA